MSGLRRRTGEIGEAAVAEAVARAGCRIVERNARTRYGELDLIFLERETLVFAEIKALRGRGPADAWRSLESVGPRKQLKVRSLARAWLCECPRPPRYAQVRFDAFGVCVGPVDRIVAIEHIPAAF